MAAWYIWRLVEAKNANSDPIVEGDTTLQKLQQEHHHHQQQQQQFLDGPINGIMNLGYHLPTRPAVDGSIFFWDWQC